MDGVVTELVAGRYAVERPVGKGGVGEVFLAHDTALNRWVALKRLRADTVEGARRAEAALREAKNLAALQHPNIVTVYDCVAQDDGVAVVMEYIAGRTLEEITAQAPLTFEDFLEIARQALDGLAAAHAVGMLHRDIKPSNLMVARAGTGALQLKILDFGLAKIADVPTQQTIDHTGSLLGSIHTMAPEQFDHRPLDERTDLYSLGCVFYQCLAGRPPFDGASVAVVMAAHLEGRYAPLSPARPDVPGPVAAWIERLISKDPAERPASAGEAAGLLKAITGRGATVTRAEISRFPWLKAGGALAVLGLLALAAFFFLPERSREESPASQPALAEASPAPAAAAAPPEATPGAETAAVNATIPTLAAGETAEFLSRLGERVRVRGLVSRVGESRSGDVLYVNFQGNTRGDLALVQFVRPELRAEARAELERFVGKTVEVEGLLTSYRGSPQIEITGPERLKETDPR